MPVRLRTALMIAAFSVSSEATLLVPALAESQIPPNPQSVSSVNQAERALRATLQDGRPTILVVSSTSQPTSRGLLDSILQSPQGRELGRFSYLVGLAAESAPDLCQRLGVGTGPAILVYRRGAKGLELVAREENPRNAYDAIGWLHSINLAGPASGPTTRDPEVLLAQYPSTQGPSPQTPESPPPPVPPPAPPQQYIPPPQYFPPPQYAPVVPGPAPTVVPAPVAPIVFQPQATQIVVGPAPPPTITFASAPVAAPNVYYAPAPGSAPVASAPPSNAPNLFSNPGNAPAPAPAPAPPVAYAPQPPAYAPQPPAYAPQPPAYAPQPVAYAPQPVAYAPQAQAPLAAMALTTILTNPNLLERVLGTIGEHFAQKKNPRIQMGQAPIAQAPIAQAPVAQAPLGYAPQGAPAAYGYAPPQAYGYFPPAGYGPSQGYGPPPGYQPPDYGPPPTTPSPQSAPAPRSRWFHPWK